MESYCTAVFDVGKTNKKLLIFDRNLNIIDSAFASFGIYKKDSIDYEDTKGIELWLIEKLTEKAGLYPIKAISITAHGATFAAIDSRGKLAIPVISYTTEPGENFHEEFYQLMGSSDSLQMDTATPRFSNLLNIAKGIYFAQRKYPDRFRTATVVLGYPQYFGHLLTGRTGAEPTYMGCHTYLWDYKNNTWSAVAEKLGIIDKLPPALNKSWEILGSITPEIAARTGLNPETVVTMGIHDSNAALLPYLLKTREDFVLNSTGTWCVAMHPAKEISFSRDEIGKVVFYNLDAFFNPVKTAIFLGGLEFDRYIAIFNKINGEKPFPAFDPRLYRQLIKEAESFILPGVLRGTGQFPDSLPGVRLKERFIPLEVIESGEEVPALFRDFTRAYAVLNLSLAIQNRVSLERIGINRGSSIFVEGGFRKNPDFNALLTAFFPSSPLFLTNLNEASAFGAAILARLAVEKEETEDIASCFNIESTGIEPVVMAGLDSYTEKFMEVIKLR
ncbi:MAG: carbohydrate kinase [Spirochaeta sp.]|nr:carbohydrate kinase [Spirochaeta sp.]